MGDSAFSKDGDWLAYTVDASAKDSNGLFVLDLKNNRLHALDNDGKSYNRLTWNDDSTALAVLKGTTADKVRERDNILVAFPNMQAAMSDTPHRACCLRSVQVGRFSERLGRQRPHHAHVERR